jgi:hypothetical protein
MLPKITVAFYLHDSHEMNAYRAMSVRPSTRLKSRAAGQISIKFGMDVMPFKASLKSYFITSYSQ